MTPDCILAISVVALGMQKVLPPETKACDGKIGKLYITWQKYHIKILLILTVIPAGIIDPGARGVAITVG